MKPSARLLPVYAALLLGALALAVPAGAAECTTNAPAGDPCFSENEDILAGDRDLVPNDDLVVTLRTGQFDTKLYALEITDLAIGSNQLTTRTANCSLAPQAKAQSLIGRMYALTNDVQVDMLLGSGCNQLLLRVTDPMDTSSTWSTTLSSDPGNLGYAGIGMGDFDRDGYQDLLTVDDTGAQAFTAVCTGDPEVDCSGSVADGLRGGPFHPLGLTGPYAGAPASGDFDGDGVLDVAWPAFDGDGDLFVEIVSVCPSAGSVVAGIPCNEALEIVPLLTVDLGASLNLTSKGISRPAVDLGAGNFDGQIDLDTGRPDDEMVVALADSDNGHATVTVWDYDAASHAMSAGDSESFNINRDDDNGARLFVEGAQLDPASAQDQAVFAYTEPSNNDHRGVIAVLSFDAELGMSVRSAHLTNNQKTRIYGMAVGRFDPPPDAVTGQIDLSKQIAVLVSHGQLNDGTAADTQLQIFRALPATSFTPSQASQGTVSSLDWYEKSSAQLSPLAAGDLQGRSLELGQPDVLTVTSTQLDVALGVPPMHVDFVPPPGESEPAVLNVSVFPETFHTGFEFENENEKETEREGSTSFGIALKAAASVKYKEGTSENSFTEEIGAGISAGYDRSVEHFHNHYQSQKYSLSAETQFDDLVVATASTLHTYIYPVLGHYACPDGEPDCSDDELEQQVVHYTGVDDITYTNPASGAAMEWYQPVTEPGNLFSYPGNLATLQHNELASLTQDSGVPVTSVDLLTPEGNLWDSQSSEAVSIQWTDGGSSGKTTEVTRQLGFDLDASAKSKAGVKDVFEETLKISGDFETSLSLGTTNTHKHSWDSTLGVTLDRGLGPDGESSNTELLYQGSTFVYGLDAVDGTIAPGLGTTQDSTQETTVTYAPLKVGHVANMMSAGLIQSGSWWRQVYTQPDIALNHPQRWLQRLPEGSVPQEIRFNCPVGFESDFEEPEENPGSCVPNADEPDTGNTALAPFYKMKGLFVTEDDNTSGPTIQSATLGDTITLQARVYNYSLTGFPAGATPHVRFYAQPWDSTTGRFLGLEGDASAFAPAVRIGEQALPAPIPAFCGGASQGTDPCASGAVEPNWVLATTQWDTSTLDPQPSQATDWKFWVVAWLEDGNGDLVDEMEGHGLSAVPSADVDSFADLPIETYSNNLGYYNQVFQLLPPTAGDAPDDTDPGGRSLFLEAIEIDARGLERHVPSMVRVRYRPDGGDYDTVRALLYEGDSAEGQLIDMDLLPPMRDGESTVAAFPYAPRTCGAHSLFVETFQSDGADPVTGAIDFFVPCEPARLGRVDGHARFGNERGRSDRDRLRLKGGFTLRRPNPLPGIDLASPEGVVLVPSLLARPDGSGDLADGLPLILVARPGNRPDTGWYESGPGATPRVRLKVSALGSPHAYAFTLEFSRAEIARPGNCLSTRRLTQFTIEDGGSMPVPVEIEAEWSCNGRSGTMRTRQDGPAPPRSSHARRPDRPGGKAR